MRTSFKATTGLMAAGVAVAGLAILAEPAGARHRPPCPKGWVTSPAPGGCAPGSMTANPKGGVKNTKKPARKSP